MLQIHLHRYSNCAPRCAVTRTMFLCRICAGGVCRLWSCSCLMLFQVHFVFHCHSHRSVFVPGQEGGRTAGRDASVPLNISATQLEYSAAMIGTVLSMFTITAAMWYTTYSTYPGVFTWTSIKSRTALRVCILPPAVHSSMICKSENAATICLYTFPKVLCQNMVVCTVGSITSRSSGIYRDTATSCRIVRRCLFLI